MATTSVLDQIAASHAVDVEPVELPRLTVADTFLTYARIQSALGLAAQSVSAIPACNRAQETTDKLKELVKACEGIVRHATRLIEANR